VTDDNEEGAAGERPIERPVTTAERVIDAIRAGATTTDAIVKHTQLNPSVVGIALTTLTRNGIVRRRRASYGGGPGPRPFVYRLTGP
jgi:DNA-binding IclR family transcriptional regulator